MLIFSDPIYPKGFEISYPGMVCSRWSRQMTLPNAARNLVSAVLVSPYGCTSSLLFLYKQPGIRGIRKKINLPGWHIYQTKLTNYQNLCFVMPGGHAFLKRNYNRALRIAFKIGDVN